MEQHQGLWGRREGLTSEEPRPWDPYSMLGLSQPGLGGCCGESALWITSSENGK